MEIKGKIKKKNRNGKIPSKLIIIIESKEKPKRKNDKTEIKEENENGKVELKKIKSENQRKNQSNKIKKAESMEFFL